MSNINEFCGVGIIWGFDPGNRRIFAKEVIEGSAAALEGLQKGDVLLAYQNESRHGENAEWLAPEYDPDRNILEDLDVMYAYNSDSRGMEGSNVKMRIARGEGSDSFDTDWMTRGFVHRAAQEPHADHTHCMFIVEGDEAGHGLPLSLVAATPPYKSR